MGVAILRETDLTGAIFPAWTFHDASAEGFPAPQAAKKSA